MLSTLRDGVGSSLESIAAALASTDTHAWGLHPLGYHHTGFNGTAAEGWDLGEPHSSFGILAVHKPGPRYVGRLTVLVDDDMTEPDSWVNVITGETTRNQRDAIGRWLSNYMRGHRSPNQSTPVDVGAIHSTHVPGVTIWTAEFTSKQEFIARLREADALMRDPVQINVQAALLGFRSGGLS